MPIIMSEEQKNPLDGQESNIESSANEESKANITPDSSTSNNTSNNPDSIDINKIKNELHSLRTAQSGKDKQIDSLAKELERMKEREQLKDKLLSDNELPEVVRSALSDDINTMSLQDYDAKRSKYVKVFEDAQKVATQRAISVTNNEPNIEEQKNVMDLINNAKTQQEIDELIAKYPDAIK